ncbi:hypothetical protein GQ600_27217 [Phytophthora cactorum]|nr:hypothetical protein GQ600_27217 [Phytophthora cactorum]
MLKVSFSHFCVMVKHLLEEEFEFAHRFPLLIPLHDLCTTSNGKRCVVGTSSHHSTKVKTLITSRIAELYGLTIACMAQFLMSDTTPSARKISKLFYNAVQLDCTMHVLNVCQVYCLGMRKNVYIIDPETNIPVKQLRVCTPGAPFQKRIGRLTKVQQLYELPNRSPFVDCDTRVAFTVTLYQRTIENYAASKAYFQHCEVYDDPDVSEVIVGRLTTVGGARGSDGSVADLALIEAQHSGQVFSQLVVLLKFAADRLHSRNYWLCDLNAIRTQRQTSIRFHALASTSLEQIKGQVNKRLSNLTAETIIILLLDPRAKFGVGTLTTARHTVTTDPPTSAKIDKDKVESVIEEGMRMLRENYAAVYATSSGVKGAALDSLPNLDVVPSIEDEVTICGAQVEMTPDNVLKSSLHDQADEFNEPWVNVALKQTSGGQLTAEDFIRLLLVRSGDKVCWRLEALFKHFPTIAALARIWLGRSPSNAYQETDNMRAEVQVLMRHNQRDVRRMEMMTGSVTTFQESDDTETASVIDRQ